MRSLARVKAGKGAAGEPLPTIFRVLHEWGIRPRRGQVTMVCAPPNCGKSLLTMYWVLRLAQGYGERVLYFSADTDEHDSKIRAAAMLTGHEMRKIENSYLESDEAGEFYDDALEEFRNVRFEFESDPTYDHIGEVVEAYCEAWGDYPETIVIDNLSNVVTLNENEFSGMKEVTKAAKRLGRQTGAAVFILHHQNESEVKDPRFPGSRKSITGKVSQYPELVLTLGMDDALGVLRIACVKNRSGKKDPSGETYVELQVDPARMSLYGSIHDRRGGIVI